MYRPRRIYRIPVVTHGIILLLLLLSLFLLSLILLSLGIIGIVLEKTWNACAIDDRVDLYGGVALVGRYCGREMHLSRDKNILLFRQ